MNVSTFPLYRCHKQVRAVKIATIVKGEPNCFILPVDTNLRAIEVPLEFIEKHTPQPGGYFVVYEDGYRSYSPAKAFESGYTRVDG